MLKELPVSTNQPQDIDNLPLKTAEFFEWCSSQYGNHNSKVAYTASQLYINFPFYILNSPGKPGHYPGLLAINKPAYISSQTGGPNNHYAVDIVAKLATGTKDIHCINRLDHNTSGIMLLGSTHAARASISKQLETRSVQKTYIAILDGEINPSFAGVVAPLAPDRTQGIATVIDPESAEAKRSYTGINLLALAINPITGDQYSVVQVKLFTGRTHQIRVHMAGGFGTPIVGDNKYNPNPPQAERQLLHSHQTTLRIPGSMQRETITAPVPEDFYEFLDEKLIFSQSDRFYKIFDKFSPSQPPTAA